MTNDAFNDFEKKINEDAVRFRLRKIKYRLLSTNAFLIFANSIFIMLLDETETIALSMIMSVLINILLLPVVSLILGLISGVFGYKTVTYDQRFPLYTLVIWLAIQGLFCVGLSTAFLEF